MPVIAKDVDGPSSLPLRINIELAGTLGRFAACRRVARTIYLGSAPTTGAAHCGIEDRRVKLGCVMPGESPAVFGDALRRRAGAATYLNQDGPRYWYSTQPTVTELAEDRAEQLKRDPDKVVQELDGRLRADLCKTGDFSRIHPLPHTGQDVPDDLDARLVVLGIDGKDPALPAARDSMNGARHVTRLVLGPVRKVALASVACVLAATAGMWSISPRDVEAQAVAFVPDSPPRASLIQVSTPDATGNVTITGAPGAASPSTFDRPGGCRSRGAGTPGPRAGPVLRCVGGSACRA